VRLSRHSSGQQCCSLIVACVAVARARYDGVGYTNYNHTVVRIGDSVVKNGRSVDDMTCSNTALLIDIYYGSLKWAHDWLPMGRNDLVALWAAQPGHFKC
jgi:hypothetical protein